MGLLDFAANVIGLDAGRKQAKKDRQMQVEFAQNGIQWKVEDAKRAGIHPLYALGAQTVSYQPSGYDGGASQWAQMGQDISRARVASMDRRERLAELDAATRRAAQQDRMLAERHKADMERSWLENTMLRSQIARLNSAQVGSPSVGNGSMATIDGGRVRPQASRPFMSARGDSRRQAGTVTDYQYVRTGRNSIGIIPSEDIAGRFDEIPAAGAGWWYRNSALPFVGVNVPRPPSERPPPGRRWVWDGTQFVARRFGERSRPYLPPGWDRNRAYRRSKLR